MEEEELTYEILEEEFRRQDKLIAEGKMERPKIVYGFTPEDRKAFDLGITWEDVFGNIVNNRSNE
jgi:hypothetical protein